MTTKQSPEAGRETLEQFVIRWMNEFNCRKNKCHQGDWTYCERLAQAVEERTAMRCQELARNEGAVPSEEGGTLARWDACDNVVQAISCEFNLKEGVI